uniref:Uncharacterized protein n=1 Tax=Picea glauca TaxID=3330 RepID=A0A117NGQ4_PICGL|nr:hypothetical protein ABT39_MTgene6171 [Picea glauca]QHR88679.1 hypothetical protein Q903MT_gene2693 [Picea sitchensis]
MVTILSPIVTLLVNSLPPFLSHFSPVLYFMFAPTPIIIHTHTYTLSYYIGMHQRNDSFQLVQLKAGSPVCNKNSIHCDNTILHTHV